MARNTALFVNFTAGPVTVVGVTETVIATTPKVSSAYAGATFAVEFTSEVTAGSDQTGLVYTVRRGSLTGTAVYTSGAITRVAASIGFAPVFVVDQIAGESASAVWVLTVTQSGGAANGAAANIGCKVFAAL